MYTYYVSQLADVRPIFSFLFFSNLAKSKTKKKENGKDCASFLFLRLTFLYLICLVKFISNKSTKRTFIKNLFRKSTYAPLVQVLVSVTACWFRNTVGSGYNESPGVG